MSSGSSDEPSPGQVYVVMTITVIIGLLLLGFSGFTWVTYQEQAQGNFEQTEATIVSSEVVYESESYRLDITYEYTVDGEVYRSSNVFPGEVESAYARSEAQEIVKNHPEGQTETVYYDPQDPSTAFLVKDEPQWAAIVGSGLFGLFAIFLAYQFRGWLPD